MATRRPAQRILVGDAGRYMGPRSVLPRSYILELEILLRDTDDLFRRHYDLPHLGGLGRWKAISPRQTWSIVARAASRDGFQGSPSCRDSRLRGP